jgi:hypothetical protein
LEATPAPRLGDIADFTDRRSRDRREETLVVRIEEERKDHVLNVPRRSRLRLPNAMPLSR